MARATFDNRSRTISRRSLTGAMALGLLAPSDPALAAPRTLRGSVSYRERMALPRGAIVEVSLLDVSRMDAPADTIAQTRVRGNRMPARYVLRFDSSRIVPRRNYALQGRILLGERLLFISTARHSVFTGGRDQTDIEVQRVQATTAAGPDSPAGRWLLEDLRGAGVIDRLQSVLQIAPDGRVSGSGGCNRMSGRATIDGARISFSPLAATRMACTPAAMDQESRFFVALGEVRSWKIDQRRRKLALLGAAGQALLTFSAL
ncbi:MAG TPA: META domain-containing protein [Bosea sp. (in: a-proteobacteria)]|uniref:META domain-containing protein n=1 Tax=Bosea sp. (in: a-proteobacteria) TaxID=1871050 RepID=UPI002E0F6135|nr:META domain-containing protein [Bosea sp. (in: a-proteobacteria)]